MACDMPDPHEFPSLDSCQKRFLWAHKEVDPASHPVAGLVLQVGDAEKFPQALGLESQDAFPSAPQWGAADAEIKVPSGENTELKRSPFQAWSRSVYSHICYAYCQGVLPYLFLPFQSIHLHFFQNLSHFFPVLACRIK